MLFFLHTNQIQYWVRGKKDLTFQEAEILLSDLTLRNARRKKRATQSYKYVLTGLLGYQNYEAQMRVVNTYYAGPPSVITSFTTELGGNHNKLIWIFFSVKREFFFFMQIEFNQSFLNLFLLIANKKRITSFSPQILHFQEWLKLLFMCLLNLYFLINI